MDNEKNSTGNLLLALLGGAVLGAGIALLYAPQSGRRTRQKLRDLSEDAEDYAVDLMQKAERTGADLLQRAERTGEEWARKGREFATDHRQEAGSEAGRAGK